MEEPNNLNPADAPRQPDIHAREEGVTPPKMYDEMDFYEMMEANVNDFHTRKAIVEGIISNAKKGDAAAQKIVERVMMESKFKNEQKLIVTDGQLKDIILLAADRYRGQGPLSTPSGTY